MNTYNLKEAEETINEIIDVTAENLKEGIKESIVVSLVGDPGIGKTDLPRQIAEKRSMGFHQLDIPQIDELVALSGFPRKIYTVVKKNNKGEIVRKEVDHDALSHYLDKGWIPSSKVEPKLGFAPPHWLAKLDNPNGSILYLNDYSRAVSHVFQAVMELLQNRCYGTWKLPDNCIIVCSENPDDGRNTVHSQDKAQLDRTAKMNIRFDAEVWADWAAQAGIPDPCINFIIKSPEVVTGNDEGIEGVSPRKWTKLFRTLSNIEDWRSEESILKIQRNGSLIVGNLANHFSTFIANGLDKIISPKEIMDREADHEEVINKLVESVYLGEENQFRNDISAILCIRLKNYLKRFGEENSVKKVDNDRLEAIFTSEKPLFMSDSLFNLLTTISGNSKFLDLAARPPIVKILSRG